MPGTTDEVIKTILMKKPIGFLRSRCLGPLCPFTGHLEGEAAMHPRGFLITNLARFCCGRCRLGDSGHGPCCTLELHHEDDMGVIDLWDDGRPKNAKPCKDLG